MLWVYYSSMIFLLGAEFTQVWATFTGREIAPEPGAVRVDRQIRTAAPG
jgi:membrane protein